MKTDYKTNVANQSSREGARPKIIVVHTTEGFVRKDGKHDISDLRDLGSFFNVASVAASSHIGIDAHGNDARYVPDSMKAWTQCNLNPVALSAELIAYSSYSQSYWMKKNSPQLTCMAKWIAYWSRKYRIPIQRGKTSGSEVVRNGICTHADLGTSGCGHSDPGSGFPMRYVILLARLIHEEHFTKQPDSRKTNRIRAKVNKERRKYGLPKMGLPK